MRSRPAPSGAGRVDSAISDRLRRVVVQVAALGERRPRRREQPAVERRDAKVAGAASGMRQPRDRAQRIPESHWRRARIGLLATARSRL